jgi:hypothetical protein
VRFIVDSFRTVRDVRRRATPGRVEFDAGGSHWDWVRPDDVGRSHDRAAGRALKAQIKVLEQGGDFGRVEHGGFDEQGRA